MQIFTLRLTLSFFALCFTSMVFAQVDNVNSSIKIIGGEPYYIHTVLEGQTLEQIANAYYSEANEILKANVGANEPLKSGIELKVPYSDESLEAMSSGPRKSIKKEEPKIVRRESLPPSEEPEPIETEIPEEQPTPIQEAVSLIGDDKLEEETKDEELVADPVEEEPVPVEKETVVAEVEPMPTVEELTPTSQKALKDLDQLSKNISESLESLAKIKAVLNEPTAHTQLMSEYMQVQVDTFFDTSQTANRFRLKEYFFVSLNENGGITRVQDERTMTNENTHYLSTVDLKSVKLDSFSAPESPNAIIPLGINIEVVKHHYKVKVKRNKVRYYATSMYVEHFDKNHPHAQMILEEAKAQNKKGKAEAVIIQSKKEVCTYMPFEYNPFGTKSEVFMKEHNVKLEKLEF